MSNKYPGGFVSLGGQIPSYSVVFDGTGDYLSVADNTALDMEASDFTMECWFKPNASASVAGQTIFGKRANAGTIGGTLLGFWGTDLKPAMYATVNGSTWGVSNVTSSVALSVGVWSHLAFTRSGSTWTIWVNGFATATATLAGTVPNNTSAFTIGATSADGSDTICASNISNARIVKGTALYTTSFTPPTGPLQNITNTSLLTCQSATLIDNSSNGFTVTAAGNAAVSSVQPPFTSYNPNNLDPALGAATPGVWTLSQALAAEVTRSWPMYDPYYNNVVLNLHGDGTNAAQNNTFLDSSSNNFTITRNGNTTQGSFSPYGQGWSNKFGGSGTDYLSVASAAPLNFGTGDFTVEMWVNPTSLSNTPTIWHKTTGAGVLTGWNLSLGPNLVYFGPGVNGGEFVTFSVSGVSVGTWAHIAVTRVGSTLTCFVNGTKYTPQTLASASSSYDNAAAVQIGGWHFGSLSYDLNGYMSNVRVTKGAAIYTVTFTPSTTPLTTTVSSGTVSLLTCQSNRFVDNSSNAYTVTAYGTTSVQRFQPFLFNTSYTPSTIGGSGYFDGTTDYITSGTGSSLNLGTNTFCIEWWEYRTSVAANKPAIQGGPGTVNYDPLFGYTDSTSNLLYLSSNNSSWDIASGVVIGATSLNAWNHFAVTRSGSTFRTFKNGVLIATFSSASSIYQSANQFTLGIGQITSQAFSGYISDARFNIGSIPTSYQTSSTTPGTSVFTPTTSPLTTTSQGAANTKLLFNMQNAAIYDNAMMNDLETVGNAQISTSVKKYGTGSMYFDGTGDYLSIPASPNFAFGTGDFTLECWLYVSSNPAQYTCIMSNWAGGNPSWLLDFSNTSGNIRFNDSGSVYLTSSSALPTGQWNHVAVSRSGTSLQMFFNGTSVASATNSTSFGSATAGVFIGAYYNNTYPLTGYIDDLRITNGVARYTTTFTPPTSQLQDQ